MTGPPIVIARPPGQLSFVLLVVASVAALSSTMLFLRDFGPVATGWGDVVDQQALNRYGLNPLPGRQTVLASLPTHLVDAAGHGARTPEIAVEISADDGTVRRVPGTLVKRLATASTHENGSNAANERHCFVLVAFVAPAVIAAGSRVVVRARFAPSAPRSPGWLPSL